MYLNRLLIWGSKNNKRDPRGFVIQSGTYAVFAHNCVYLTCTQRVYGGGRKEGRNTHRGIHNQLNWIQLHRWLTGWMDGGMEGWVDDMRAASRYIQCRMSLTMIAAVVTGNKVGRKEGKTFRVCCVLQILLRESEINPPK